MSDHIDDKLVTVSVVAERLGMTSTTIRRWIKDGKIAAVRYPSGQFRVAESAIVKIQQTSAYTS